MSIGGVGCCGGGYGGYDSMSINQMRQNMFKKWDTDGNGTIDANEVQTAASTMSQKTGLSITSDQIMSIFDVDQDGSISQSEFTQASSTWEDHMKNLMDAAGISPMGPPPSSDATSELSDLANKIFAAVDTNGDGTISQSEYDAALQQLEGQSAGTTASSNTTDSSSSAASSTTAASTATDATSSSDSTTLAALLQQFLNTLAQLQDDQYSQYSQNSQNSQSYLGANSYA